MDQQIPVGYRFDPSDEELVEYFLKPKVKGLPRNSPIVEKDLYDDKPPWEIFTEEDFKPLGKSVYVYTRLKKAGSKWIQRKLCSGTWSGQSKDIIRNSMNDFIGVKTSLTFKGNNSVSIPKGSWLMQEYSLADDFTNHSNYVLCRMKWKDFGSSRKRRFQEIAYSYGGFPGLKVVWKQSGQGMCINGGDLGESTSNDDELEKETDKMFAESNREDLGFPDGCGWRCETECSRNLERELDKIELEFGYSSSDQCFSLCSRSPRLLRLESLFFRRV